MNLRQKLTNVFIEKNSSLDEALSSHLRSLDENGQKLLLATAKLFGAYCASPAFSKSRQLDILAENNKDMKILKALIRDYGQGVENILNAYNEYFQLPSKQDFWDFFNNKLDLPSDWLEIEKAKNEN